MTIRIQRILCPVDFSDTSKRALHYALDLGRRHRAEVSVLYVAARTLPPLSALAVKVSGTMETGVRERLRRDLLEELRLFVEPAAEGVRVACAVEEGNIVDSIVARAAEADLLVLGTHGHGEIENLVLGSVTEKALHKSPRPVLTVPPHDAERAAPAGPFQRILCPVDFSPASEEGLRHAVALAREDDGRITLLHVIEGLLGEKPLDLHLDVRGYLHKAEEVARERLRTLLAGEEARLQDGPPVIATGKAYAEILRTAEERKSDLIVMGVHGRSAMGLLLFGSAARHVVRGARCPVLTVRGK
jgi:nucleotide-binding universal stress UspA family protein